MEPLDLEDPGVGLDATLEVHVITLLDVLHVQVVAGGQGESRSVWRPEQSVGSVESLITSRSCKWS